MFAAFATVILSYLVKVALAVAISYGVGYLTRPKGGLKAATLDTVNFPTIEEGRTYPILFGTCLFEGPDTAWWGDRGIDKHRRNDITVWIYYSYGAHLIYCAGPVDDLLMVMYGGKVAWPTPEDETDFAEASDFYSGPLGETRFYVGANDLWGGREVEGGLVGYFQVNLGESDQIQDTYLIDQLGADIPAFRGVFSLTARGPTWGTTPYPKPLQGLLKRTITPAEGSTAWYTAKATVNTYDMNPVHMIRECLTNTQWGEAISSGDLGDTWESVADTMYTEGIGLSAKFLPDPENLQTFIQEIESTANIAIYDDPITGKLEIRAIRDDYTVANLPHFDRDDFEIVEFFRPHWRDVPGRIVTQFTNRLHPSETATTAPYFDNAVIANQGGRISEAVLSRPVICDADLATELNAREARALTARPATLTLECQRIMSTLTRGEPFVIAYDDAHVPITQMVCRVIEIEDGGSANPTITIKAMEDVWGIGYTVYGTPSDLADPGAVTIDLTDVITGVTGSPSSSPSTSVSASESEGTPSASTSASPSTSISNSPSSSPSST